MLAGKIIAAFDQRGRPADGGLLQGPAQFQIRVPQTVQPQPGQANIPTRRIDHQPPGHIALGGRGDIGAPVDLARGQAGQIRRRTRLTQPPASGINRQAPGDRTGHAIGHDADRPRRAQRHIGARDQLRPPRRQRHVDGRPAPRPHLGEIDPAAARHQPTARRHARQRAEAERRAVEIAFDIDIANVRARGRAL